MKRAVRVPLPGGLREGLWELPEASGHYVARVLRRARGDALLLFDPAAALEAEAQIESVDGARVQVRAGPARPASAPSTEVTVVQALGKGDKMNDIVRDATELGATRIVPVVTARTVVRPGDKASARAERWRRVAAEAARQCGRAQAPAVDDPLPLGEIRVEAELRLVLAPRAARAAGPLLLGASDSVAVLIGPEGGLGDAEIEALEGSGWVAASLGLLVLRTETVAAAVLGALLLARGAREP